MLLGNVKSFKFFIKTDNYGIKYIENIKQTVVSYYFFPYVYAENNSLVWGIEWINAF